MQLNRMFGPIENALADRQTEFPTPVFGSYFPAPLLKALQRIYGRRDRA
jgi:hypothetical protein